MASHNVQVILVHEGWSGSTEAQAAAWLAAHGATFPAIHEASPYPIMSSYIGSGSGGVPHTYIIGRDMVIRKDIYGAVSCASLEGQAMDVVHMRDPVDIEMVMDVSNSMNSPSPSDPTGDDKLIMMRRAATMITDFLNDHGQVDDRMGLVWFTDDVDEYVKPSGDKLLPVQIDWFDLRSQINAHGTGTCTAMGAGLQTAFNTLSASTNDRFAILCTDGMQNIEPKVTKVGAHYQITDSGGWLCGGHSSVAAAPGVNITSHNTCVHTIGVGITATYSTLLQEVADATGAFYRGTDDPDTDLDLIYFLDLCNCLAGGSPVVIHHNAGVFYPEACQVEETFYVNRSMRKIIVMLSWKKVLNGSLTFWLYAPDGRLIDLHDSMKYFDDYCTATVYLPETRGGGARYRMGRWRMVIRGETKGANADYHAIVIGDDPTIKFKIDFARKVYAVGDILPLKVRILEGRKPVTGVKDITVETAQLRVPLGELFAAYRASTGELIERVRAGAAKYKKDPVRVKVEAMATDPQFGHYLKPVRTVQSLSKGDLECKIGEKEITIPVRLMRSGMCSLKVSVMFETKTSGPIHRVEQISVFVAPGRVDPKQTRVSVIEIVDKTNPGLLARITPRNAYGQLLGPGYAREMKILMGGRPVRSAIEDLLDGTYEARIALPKKTKGKKRRTTVQIALAGDTLWREMV